MSCCPSSPWHTGCLCVAVLFLSIFAAVTNMLMIRHRCLEYTQRYSTGCNFVHRSKNLGLQR